VETLDYVMVMDVVGFIEDHDERIFDGVSEKLENTVDRSIPGELLADVRWMLTERLAKDCPGTLTEASDVCVRNGGSFFEPIERVAREHRFPHTAGPADQGIVWGRSAERWLKRTRELTHF
jgi:hypothetical protein